MKEFNEWMARIGNIYYADNLLMSQAFEKIDKQENKKRKTCQVN